MPLPTTVVQLPRTYNDPTTSPYLSQFGVKSKEVRLHALKTSPRSFGSSHEREIAFEAAIWEDRLSNQLARTFMALDLSNEPNLDATADLSTDIELISRVPWVGMITTLGPRLFDGVFPSASSSPWELFRGYSAEGVSSAGDGEARKSLLYMINGMYVDPVLRGQGVGRRLLQEALRALKEDCSGEEARIALIMVDKDNEPARKLYEGCGFWVVGEQPFTSLQGEIREAIGLRLDLN